MNRNNIWIHLGVAVIVITFAAVLGQIRSWEKMLSPMPPPVSKKPVAVKRSGIGNDAEVMVKFRGSVSPAEIKRIVAKNNDAIEDRFEPEKGWFAIDDLDNRDMREVAAEYAQMKDLVEQAEPNFKIELDDQNLTAKNNFDFDARRTDDNPIMPNDPMFGDQWALNNSGQNGGKANADVAALKAWMKTQGSEDVVVAVLDTGVDYTHPDLISNMWLRPANVPQYSDEELGTFDDLHGFDAAENFRDPMDDNGHGTHCSGIIGAEGDNSEGISGINWRVKIMPLKFLGRGGFGTTKDAIEAINYAIDRKQHGVNVRIISASWGSTQYSKALEDAIRAAGEEGILFIAAAGNSSTDNDNRPHYPSNYDLPNVVSVASLDRSDELSSFSNYGVKTVHLAAPGREILSTWLGDQYREASGTSMATPYVSGVAALILAKDPNLSVEKLRERLLKSVDKIDSLSGKVETGGRINAAKALE